VLLVVNLRLLNVSKPSIKCKCCRV